MIVYIFDHIHTICTKLCTRQYVHTCTCTYKSCRYTQVSFAMHFITNEGRSSVAMARRTRKGYENLGLARAIREAATQYLLKHYPQCNLVYGIMENPDPNKQLYQMRFLDHFVSFSDVRWFAPYPRYRLRKFVNLVNAISSLKSQ